MRLAIEQVDAAVTHVFLSPHLDDAIFSVGGIIAKLRDADERVLVVSICTGAPPRAATFSDFALELHRLQGLGAEEVLTVRKAEEMAAMSVLGIDFVWVGELDAIYRRPDEYCSLDTLFGPVAEDDGLATTVRAVCAEVHARAPAAVIHAPLAVGNHVDHQSVHRGARAAGVRRYYEDFPYVAQHAEALAQRQVRLDGAFRADLVDVTATLASRIEACQKYASQFQMLGGTADEFVDLAARYASAIGAGISCEREWILEE